ncbi:hypothetical protein LXA43DRAFT_153441 [Ganoderma leucocontextum]|nr:hypothetical protein LXA43DRAFT_153441 [Ganoderma leucocontextum]
MDDLGDQREHGNLNANAHCSGTIEQGRNGMTARQTIRVFRAFGCATSLDAAHSHDAPVRARHGKRPGIETLQRNPTKNGEIPMDRADMAEFEACLVWIETVREWQKRKIGRRSRKVLCETQTAFPAAAKSLGEAGNIEEDPPVMKPKRGPPSSNGISICSAGAVFLERDQNSVLGGDLGVGSQYASGKTRGRLGPKRRWSGQECV